MEWLDQDAEDFSSPSGSLAGDESGSDIEDLQLHHHHHNDTQTPSFDSPEILASYVGSPMRDHHSQGLAFFDAADCPQTDDDFIDDEDSGPEEEDESDTACDAQASAIAEIFRCFICLGKVVEAQLCPCCSKICCLRCIKRWLMDQRPQCPHCRASLRVSQLVNCRFIADLSTELEKLQKNGLGEAQETACSLHNNPMSYYCNTCTSAVCSDCAVFREEHRGHSFERLLAVYERHVETIRGEAVGLRRRLKDLCALVSEKDKNIERVHKAKDEAGLELQLAFEGMQARLEQQLKSKLLTLLAQKGSMTQEIEGLDAMMHDLNLQLNTVPQSELVGRSTGICGMLQEVQQRPTSDVNRTPVPTDFISEVVPPYDQGEFVLHDFERVLRRTSAAAAPAPSPHGVASVRTVEPLHGSNAAVNPSEDASDGAGVVYSQPIQAAGIVWRLKVYPNGNGVAAGSYLSVFLEMVQGGSAPAKYEYKIEMLHRTRPNQSVIREFASVFEVGECWGYNRFFRLEVLKEEGYVLPEEDVITLRFHVRAPTYAQQCQDLRRALVTLDGEKSDALKQVDVLRRAFADTLWWKRCRKMPANRDPPAGSTEAEDAVRVFGDLKADVSSSNGRQRDDVTRSEAQPGWGDAACKDVAAGWGQKSGFRQKVNGTGNGNGKRKAGGGSKRLKERRSGVAVGAPPESRPVGDTAVPGVSESPPGLGLPERENFNGNTGANSAGESDEEYVEALEGSLDRGGVSPAAEPLPSVPPQTEVRSPGVSEPGSEPKAVPGECDREDCLGSSEASDEEFIAALERSANGTWSRDMVLDSAAPNGLPRFCNPQRTPRRIRMVVPRRAEAVSKDGGQKGELAGGEGVRERVKSEVKDKDADGGLSGRVTEEPCGDSFARSQGIDGGLPRAVSDGSREPAAAAARADETGRSADLGTGESEPTRVAGEPERLSPVDSDTLGQPGEEETQAEEDGKGLGPGTHKAPVESDRGIDSAPILKQGGALGKEVNWTASSEIGPSNEFRCRNERLDEAVVGGCSSVDPATLAAASSPGEIRRPFGDTERSPLGDASNASAGNGLFMSGPETDKENVCSSVRLPARPLCFMERVAKVNLVVEGKDATCALGRSPSKGVLTVKPLGPEIKNRLRSEGRFFLRGRERKGSGEDARAGISVEETRAEKSIADGPSSGPGHASGQAWRNNPFVKPAERGAGDELRNGSEAESPAEPRRKRDWEVLLDRAISSREALEDIADSGTGLNAIPSNDRSEGESR